MNYFEVTFVTLVQAKAHAFSRFSFVRPFPEATFLGTPKGVLPGPGSLSESKWRTTAFRKESNRKGVPSKTAAAQVLLNRWFGLVVWGFEALVP